MMAGSRLPLVSNDLLLLPDRPGEQQAPVIVGSDVWYSWLTSESARSFTFRSQLGTFTARRERKRNGWYWYIYRKQKGKLRKAYLGKAKEITLERLAAVTETLVSRGESGDASARAPGGKSSPLPTASVDDRKKPGDREGRHYARFTHTGVVAGLAPARPTPALTFSAELEKANRQNLPVQSTSLIGRQLPRPIEWDGLVSVLHRNSAYLERRAALISSHDTSGATDNCPVLAQSCRTSNVRIVMFRAPTKSA